MRTQLRCPNCRRVVPPPLAWYHDLIVWGNVLLMGSALAWLFLDPPASLIASCLKYAKAGAESTASCYAPPEPWLALGWLAYGALVVAFGFWIRSEVRRYRREMKAWPAIEERLVREPRKFEWRW